MMTQHLNLPALNATLNAVAAGFLVFGYVGIRLKMVRVHLAFMLLALITSAAFLTSYLIYHYTEGHVPFHGKGYIRWVYFPMFISHVILAVAIVPMVFMTVIPALRRKFDKHKRIARWTLPIWLYVSVTGVLVYLMAHIWYV